LHHDFESKKQRKEYFCQVNYVGVEGPIIQSKWSHIPITFTHEDLQLWSFSHTDAFVIQAHVASWEIARVLIDNGSQADILFLHTLEKMNIARSQLKPSFKPFYGFGGKTTLPVGNISLPVSFGNPSNARTEYITFDVIDMYYPYNAIFGRGTINTFEVITQGAYLCMKMPAPLGVITLFGDQREARNIELGCTTGQRNVHTLEASSSNTPSVTVDDECPTKAIPLDSEVQGKKVTIN
jgi:hypothetical protein